MSNKDGRDFLYLIWKEPNSRRNYIVGELSKNGQFEFSYGYDVKEAIKEGFELLIPFENLNETYKSDTLFPAFSSRLPDRKRRGIKGILEKYGLKEFDEYKLLKRSGARLPIDTLQFIDPIFTEYNGEIQRVFYIEGVRYYVGCDGLDCEKSKHLEIGDELFLDPEPLNKFDKYAIKILDKEDKHIGYIPRYYGESISGFLNQDRLYRCTVLEVNKGMECNECVKIKLEIQCDLKQLDKIS